MISSKVGEERAEVARPPGEFSGWPVPVAQPRAPIRDRRCHVTLNERTLVNNEETSLLQLLS